MFHDSERFTAKEFSEEYNQHILQQNTHEFEEIYNNNILINTLDFNHTDDEDNIHFELEQEFMNNKF
jgi:hypothetical protein